MPGHQIGESIPLLNLVAISDAFRIFHPAEQYMASYDTTSQQACTSVQGQHAQGLSPAEWN